MVVHTFKVPLKSNLGDISGMALSLKSKPRLRLRKQAPTPGSKVPKIKLNNGEEMPALGIGTLTSKPSEVTQSVTDAILAGGRMVDCAASHLNEPEVGKGIQASIEAGGVKREDLFIVSKLWNTSHRPDLVEPAQRKTLKDLQVSYLDMYLIHFPTAFYEEGHPLFPRNDLEEILYSDVDYLDTWKAMEDLVQKGLVKSIGISNFNSKQVERLLQNCRIPPVLNQIEIHPYLSQRKLIEFCRERNIAVTGYCALRSPDTYWENEFEPALLKDPKLVEIAYKYNKSVAQLIIRWLIQRGVAVISKSIRSQKLQENLNVFDFHLTNEDMEIIYSLNKNDRSNIFQYASGHKDYPFNIEF